MALILLKGPFCLARIGGDWKTLLLILGGNDRLGGRRNNLIWSWQTGLELGCGRSLNGGREDDLVWGTWSRDGSLDWNGNAGVSWAGAGNNLLDHLRVNTDLVLSSLADPKECMDMAQRYSGSM